MVKLISITRSDRKGKKFVAKFDDGTQTHFGAAGYEDFTTTGDEDRKQRYLDRHRANESWNDFKSAGSLARWILWNKPTLSASIKDFKNRFNL
jgi:hypothetical protein